MKIGTTKSKEVKLGDKMANEMVVSTNIGIPSEHEMMVFQTMSKSAVESKMYKGIGDQAGVMMIMLSARELGIPAMQALNGGLNIINGKVEISARMMNALIRKAGHRITIKEFTETKCVIQGTRGDTGESQLASFSFVEAQKAGLIKPGGGWTKWPKDMCFARALSRLARQLFSDVIGIGYVEGEIRATEAEVIIPEEIIEEAQLKDEDLSELSRNFLTLFSPEDAALAEEYILKVQKSFGWSETQTFQELLKDSSKTLASFKTWKEKQEKGK